MAGDEPRAKQLLLAMQERLARDPYEALGVTPSSPPGDVRNAFLGLTKTYHPARFARMAVDVQKLANEVFLALRAAHDQLSRPSVNAASSSRRSGPIPVMPRSSTPPQTAPHAPRTTTPQQPSSGVPTPYAGAPTAQHAGAPTAPPSSSPARPEGRLPTAPLGMRPVQRFVPPASAITRPYGAPTTPPPTTPSATPPSPATPAPTTPPGAPRTPAPSLPAMSRTNTSRIIQQGRSPAPTPTPAATPSSSPRVTPAAGVPAIAGSRTPTLDRELAPILELLTQGQFAASRLALETLAARSPDVPRYRALIAYAKGREAQLARQIDEARVELQEALQIDPTLELAKTALAELFTRRK